MIDNSRKDSSAAFQQKIYLNYKFIKFKTHLGHKILNFSLQKQCDSYFTKLLLGTRLKVSVIHNEILKKSLLKSFYVLALILRTNGHILIINTTPEFSKFFYYIKQIQKQKTFTSNSSLHINDKNLEKINTIGGNSAAFQTNNGFISYCNNKWIGGTLTNWKQIKKSVLTFAKFSNNFDNFVSSNTIHFPRYKKMKKCFSGFFINQNNKNSKNNNIFLQQNPDLIFLINPNENSNIIKEANLLNIPVIALTDSNTKITGITFPIPSNNKSVSFVYWCLNWIIRFYKKI